MTRRNLLSTAIAGAMALCGWKPAKPVYCSVWCETKKIDVRHIGGPDWLCKVVAIPIIQFTFDDGTKRRFEGDDFQSSEVERLYGQMQGAL